MDLFQLHVQLKQAMSLKRQGSESCEADFDEKKAKPGESSSQGDALSAFPAVNEHNKHGDCTDGNDRKVESMSIHSSSSNSSTIALTANSSTTTMASISSTIVTANNISACGDKKKNSATLVKPDISLKLIRSFSVRSVSEASDTLQNFYSDALSLTLSEKDDLIISDAGKQRLRVFDLDGNLKTEILSTDLPDSFPACVCCIPDRCEVVVSHCFAFHGIVLKSTPDFAKLRFSNTFQMEGARCWGMAYSPLQDRLVVAHEQYKKISCFDPQSWKLINQFVTDGAPLYIALNATGSKIFVTTSDENRVEVYDESGDWLGHYGTMGKRRGQFMGIAGLAVDKSGNCIVCDKGNHRLQMLTVENKWLSMKAENESANFKSPTDVKITSAGLLCVLANNCVFIFEKP